MRSDLRELAMKMVKSLARSGRLRRLKRYALAAFGSLLLSAFALPYPAAAQNQQPSSDQLFNRGGAAQDMFNGYAVGGGRKNSGKKQSSGDSFDASASSSSNGSEKKRAGSQMILPSFSNAPTSAVVEPTPAPKLEAPRAQLAKPAAKEPPTNANPQAAAVEQAAANGKAPSADYYRQLINKVQGKTEEVKADANQPAAKPRGITKDNKF